MITPLGDELFSFQFGVIVLELQEILLCKKINSLKNYRLIEGFFYSFLYYFLILDGQVIF